MSRHRQSAVRRELAPRVFAGLILAAGMGVGGALFTLYRDVLARPPPKAAATRGRPQRSERMRGRKSWT